MIRTLRCLFGRVYVSQNSRYAKYSWVASQAATDETLWRDVVYFVFRQNKTDNRIFRVYTHTVIFFVTKRSVGWSHENDRHEFCVSQRPRRTGGFVTPPATSIACTYSASRENIPHCRRVTSNVYMPACVLLLLKKGYSRYEWLAMMKYLGRDACIFDYCQISLTPLNPVNIYISELIEHITRERTQTQDFPVLLYSDITIEHNFLSLIN